jgi:hypothetical protein
MVSTGAGMVAPVLAYGKRRLRRRVAQVLAYGSAGSGVW